MKMFFGLMLSLTACFAKADLYDRIQLEDSLRSRVEDVLKIYDHNIRVLIRIEYKSYEGVLPGTNIVSEDAYTPAKIESNDVAKINVELYTDKPNLNPDAQALVYRIIPFDKSKVNVELKKIDKVMAEEMKKGLDSESVSNIMKHTSEQISKWFAMVAVGCLAGLVFFSFFMDNRRMKEFKAQIALVINALSESKSQAPVPQSWSEQATTLARGSKDSSENSDEALKKMAGPALKELMADCYWCGQDAYASWIWKKISNEQRKDLLAQLPFMKDYSHFIVDLRSVEESYHDHPYYLDPANTSSVSQIDMSELVQQNVSLWHSLSPMRQNTLALPLETKLTAIQSKPSKLKIQSSKSSPYRELSITTSMGDLSEQDEQALYEKPELVPVAFKRQVKSLVWLALQPESQIQTVLSRYDARSLATAWLAPQQVLEKLEKSLPEKKLKLLQTYKSKTTPSRNAPVYMQLVSEGLRDEAA